MNILNLLIMKTFSIKHLQVRLKILIMRNQKSKIPNLFPIHLMKSWFIIVKEIFYSDNLLTYLS